jgi:uncharacterized protein
LQGDAWAHYQLGSAYLTGDGLPQNTLRAMQHLHAAAEQGVDLAQWLYGSTLADSADTLEEARDAVAWLRRSRAQGLSYAQETVEVVCARIPAACLAP